MPLIWTSEKPQVAGWYWWRAAKGGRATIYEVSSRHVIRADVFTVGHIVLFLDELPGQWAGPLDPPQEPGGPA